MTEIKGIRFIREGENKSIVPFLEPLFMDLCDADTLLNTDNNDFHKRVFVRSAFSYLDAYLYWLRLWLIGILEKQGRISLNTDVDTIFLLKEDVPKPKVNGSLEMDKNRIPFINLCALTIRSALVANGIAPDPFFSDNGWRKMHSSIKVRHRITHPKIENDNIISEDEMFDVRESIRWFMNCIIEICNAPGKNLLDKAVAERGERIAEIQKKPKI